MHTIKLWRATLVLATAAAVAAMTTRGMSTTAKEVSPPAYQHALKSVTLNTRAYSVDPGKIDRRSIELVAPQDMHLVALEHFIGVGKGALSDNGHILSTSPENPWVKWESAGTGMEPTGVAGYFGYCGRDYYSEVDGIDDVMAYESFPAGTHVLVRRGQTLYVHCYAANFSGEQVGYFHHMVRVLYW